MDKKIDDCIKYVKNYHYAVIYHGIDRITKEAAYKLLTTGQYHVRVSFGFGERNIHITRN